MGSEKQGAAKIKQTKKSTFITGTFATSQRIQITLAMLPFPTLIKLASKSLFGFLSEFVFATKQTFQVDFIRLVKDLSVPSLRLCESDTRPLSAHKLKNSPYESSTLSESV